MAQAQKKKEPRKLSAVKRARQNEKRHVVNSKHESRLKTQLKAMRKALDAKNKVQIEKLLPLTVSVLGKMVTKKIIHRNKAARLTSRLTHRSQQI